MARTCDGIDFIEVTVTIGMALTQSQMDTARWLGLDVEEYARRIFQMDMENLHSVGRSVAENDEQWKTIPVFKIGGEKWPS